MNREVQPVLQAIQEIKKAVIGKDDCIVKIMTAILAGGHILIEDIPGVGKTTMALAFSRALGLRQNRIQFTPDVLPSDVVGFSMYQKSTGKFEYQPGAVMCNLLLADEINRTSPKTQSALLEVMEEGKVTVDHVTRELPKPFVVIATQNPSGTAGTQPQPEAQVDRFMINLSLGYPDFESELSMAKSIGEEDRLSVLTPLLSGRELKALQEEVCQVYIKEELYRYLLKLVTATREHPYIRRGASPRATIALVKMARACAWIAGRDYVIPSDISRQFPYVIGHRILLKPQTAAEGISREEILKEILAQVRKPSMGDGKK